MSEIIPFKTYEEQLFKITDKNVNFNPDDMQEYIEKLKNHSYYALVNGYKHHFLKSNHTDTMKDGTQFNHLYACKILEMDISAIMLKYLQIIEQGFRTRVAYIIAREFGTDEKVYSLDKHYISKSWTSNQALNELRRVIEKPYPNSYSHYFKKIRKPRASIPPWIALQDMQFHKVIELYRALPEKLRIELLEDYIQHNPNLARENKYFIECFHFIREYRNIYAHSKRDFDEKFDFSLHYQIFKQFKYNHLLTSEDFDEKKRTKTLAACIATICSLLNDEFLVNRFTSEFSFLIINDEYMDNGKPKDLFNGKSVLDILGFSLEFLYKIITIVDD
ncbi:Abi family protein [Dolosigranulum pigrum]|uniref:Abi family protein n=1 Tax=Dolosigranulum pigrum TaxID=29394 RepID=UPI001AD89E92|nr:Abi family protein [Dolosigranulum pigrum]